jgi:hypothetical protein
VISFFLGFRVFLPACPSACLPPSLPLVGVGEEVWCGWVGVGSGSMGWLGGWLNEIMTLWDVVFFSGDSFVACWVA